jgi:hypothetical protein
MIHGLALDKNFKRTEAFCTAARTLQKRIASSIQSRSSQLLVRSNLFTSEEEP